MCRENNGPIKLNDLLTTEIKFLNVGQASLKTNHIWVPSRFSLEMTVAIGNTWKKLMKPLIRHKN
jgi:hypothetical protein